MKNMFPMFKGKRKNKYKKDARKLSNSEKVGDPTLNPLLEETAESSKMIAMENGLSSAVYHSNGTSADDKIFSGGKKFVESNNDDIETLENWSIDAIRNKFVENDVDIARRGRYICYSVFDEFASLFC